MSLAVATLYNNMEFPEGTIHASQQINFKKTAKIGQTLYCQASVIRNQQRRGLFMLTLQLEITDETDNKLMDGQTVLVFPENTSKDFPKWIMSKKNYPQNT